MPGETDGTSPDALLAIGEVLKPWGISGELKVRVACDGSEHFAECLGAGDPYIWKTASPSGQGPPPPHFSPRRVHVQSVRFHQAFALLRLEGVDSIETSEALRGALIGLPPGRLPPAGEDTYYYYQLEGMQIVADGAVLGTVERVEENPAHEQLLVRPAQPGLKPFRVPLVGAFVKRVDLASGRIETELPEGLIESQT